MLASSRISSFFIDSRYARSGPFNSMKLPRPFSNSRHKGHVGSLDFQSSMHGRQYAWKQVSTLSICLSKHMQHKLSSLGDGAPLVSPGVQLTSITAESFLFLASSIIGMASLISDPFFSSDRNYRALAGEPGSGVIDKSSSLCCDVGVLGSKLKLSMFSSTVSRELTLDMKSLTDLNFRMNTMSSSIHSSAISSVLSSSCFVYCTKTAA